MWPPASRGAGRCFQVKAFDSYCICMQDPPALQEFQQAHHRASTGPFHAGLDSALLVPGIKGGCGE